MCKTDSTYKDLNIQQYIFILILNNTQHERNE